VIEEAHDLRDDLLSAVAKLEQYSDKLQAEIGRIKRLTGSGKGLA
jgi:hypothetical protein